MDGIVALLLSKKFTKDTVIGMGAIKGAACQVQSINKVNKTTTITLEWEDNVGTSHTQSFDIEDGADGVSVVGATIKPNGHLELTLSNGNSIDCGQVLPQYDTMPTPSSSNEGQILQYIGTTTSNYTNGYFYECIDDDGVYKWVEKSVQDSYTKIEIGDLSQLPDNTKNVVENINNIKLSVDQLSASKLSISDIDDELSDASENPVQNKVIKLTLDQLQGSILDKLNEKEDKFRYSTMPTASVEYLNKIVEYIGATDSTYTNGYFYQCRFDGINYSWIQKNIQPSSGGTGGDGVVDGYYNATDHLFYEEAGYINPISGDDNTLYVSLDTNLLYRYNGLIFIRVDESSSGEDDVINGYYNSVDGKFYEESTYTTEIIGETGKIYISIDTNIQYRWDNISVPNKFVTISSSIAVDNELSTTSENPVQNKVITLALEQLQGSMANKANKVNGATADDFVVLNASGDLVDSGINKNIVPNDASSSNQLATKGDIKTYTGDNGVDIDVNNKITLNISYLTASRVGYVPSTEKGANNGVATLDSAGKVPSTQLPSYVDDIIEGYKDGANFYSDSAHTQLITPENGKIYVDLTTNTTWRWGGSAYVQVSESLALGETATTAYYGDKGKTAYDHSQITSGNPHNVTATDVGLGNVTNTGDSDTPISGGTTKFTTGGAYTELNKKADKVSGATNGHLAKLDSNGNLADSGKSLSDLQEKLTEGDGIDIANNVVSVEEMPSADMSEIVTPTPTPIVPYMGNPTGCIIQMMGVNAPDGYLKCDGQVYNIADYQNLADYFYAQFGSKNKFGGNGTTTFAVPDLRGEFLRGTGTNSHTNQGSGSDVGIHQDSTNIPNLVVASNGIIYGRGTSAIFASNIDGTTTAKTTTYRYNGTSTTSATATNEEVNINVRPTNTSVLYCIKY